MLRIRRGLFARRALSVPLQRVDGVVIVEGLLRSPLGLAALRLETVAHGSERRAGQDAAAARAPRRGRGRHRAPDPRAGGRAGRASGPAAAGAAPLRAAARARRRPLPASAPRSRWRRHAWPAALALAAIGALVGLRAYRAAAIRLAGDVVVVREARLARRTLLARRHRLQEHAVARTPLQARADLADLSVTVGSGGGGRARHLESATAEAAFAALRRS